MDIQRIILIAGIALISYMLLIEWNSFQQAHSPKSITTTSQTSPAADKQTPLANNNADIPAEDTETPDTSHADIPVAINQPVPTPVATNNTAQKLIYISSDVLDLHINPRGGDIVYAALKKYYQEANKPDQPFVLLQQNSQLNYIAQSGLVGQNGTDNREGKALFQTSQTQYQLAENAEELIVDLTLQNFKGANIIKRFRLQRDSYLIHVEYIIHNISDHTWQANLYQQIKRDGSPDPASKSSSMGMAPFLGFATTTSEERFRKINFDDVRDEKLKENKTDGWIAMIQHYFLSAWIAEKGLSYQYSAIETNNGDYIARATGPVMNIAPGQSKEIKSGLYVGPKDQYKLAKIAEGLDLSVDYGWLWWIAQPLYALLYFFYTGELHMFGTVIDLGIGVGNWGVAIILLTLIVKLVFFYPSAMSYRSMAKMRNLQPKLMRLKDLYPDDRQKQSQEMMSLYRKEGVNPLGGCLPMLIQMPVFISLYWVLLESVELRHAPFVGYIKDLSAMDPYFILPLIMGASMFLQQKLNPTPPDPMQAKIMQWMPVIFTVFFLWFPAGLVLYWVVNNILSIAQQYIITKQIEAAADK